LRIQIFSSLLIPVLHLIHRLLFKCYITSYNQVLHHLIFYIINLLHCQAFYHAYEGDENIEIRETLKSIHDDLDDMTYLRPAWKKVRLLLLTLFLILFLLLFLFPASSLLALISLICGCDHGWCVMELLKHYLLCGLISSGLSLDI
jgi:hypothetical protein